MMSIRWWQIFANITKMLFIVINAGGQVDLSFMDEFSNIKALLVIVQPGMEGGNAFCGCYFR